MGVGALWPSCLHAASDMCRTLWISAPGQSFLATRSVPTTRTAYDHVLDDLHLGGTHLECQHGVPWGPPRTDLQFWALSVGMRLPDESQNSVNSVGSVYLLHLRCVPPEAYSDLSASVPSASLTLCSTLGPLSGLQTSW